MKKLEENFKFNHEEYVSIYKLAEMIGKDPKGLMKESSRERFILYLNNLPKGTIKMVTLDNSIITEVEYPSVKTLYSRSSVQQFLKNYTRKTDILRLMNLKYIGIQQLLLDNSIPEFKLGLKREMIFYPNNMTEKYYYPIDFEQYMNIFEIGSCKFGKKPSDDRFFRGLKKQISELPEGMIKKIRLDLAYKDTRINRFIKEVFSRDDVERFFSNYILKNDAFKDIMNYGSLYSIRKYFKKLGVHEITLGGNINVFILKSDYRKLKKLCTAITSTSNISAIRIYADIFNYLTIDEVMKILNLSKYATLKLIVSKRIIVDDEYNKQKLFNKDDINKIYGEQVKLLQEYKCKYYTYSEIKEKYDCQFAKRVIGKDEELRRPIDRKRVPIILRGHLGSSSKICYNILQVDGLWHDYNIFEKMNSITIEDPFEDFIYKVEHTLKIEYSSEQKKTKELWYQYTLKIFENTKISDKARITFMVNQYARNTEEIFNIFKKEIYTYRAEEVNQLYLNSRSGIPRSHQSEFYYFLKQLMLSFRADELPLPFTGDELNNPFEYEKIKDIDTSIYSVEEYHALYEHVNRVEYHKQKAINSVRMFYENNTKYNHYDSCWLYILIQLTNNWRHSTVITQIPRINLSFTQIKSMEWLVHNDPSLEDANSIIYQIGRYVTNINKTDVSAEGIFNIGQPLKIAFAIAISICEFRAQESIQKDADLINLSGNLLSKCNPHKEFFKDFISGFKFENRKMNRTLSTLIWSVLRHLGGGVTEAKVSRSHLREETTINHYIKLTDKQVEHLILEMFERNQFGYVTQMLTNILFGTEADKSVETRKMVAINNNFGDVIKIEATAGLINKLAIDKQEVIQYLQGFSLEEIHIKYNQMLAGNLPSKKKYFQCIYSKCMLEVDYFEPPCDGCAASIINVYALSNIMDNYVYYMKKVIKEFDKVVEGEKNKLANHLYLIHAVVEQARMMFGRDVVDGFVEGKTGYLKVLGSLLTPKKLKQYRTCGVIKGGKTNGTND